MKVFYHSYCYWFDDFIYELLEGELFDVVDLEFVVRCGLSEEIF